MVLSLAVSFTPPLRGPYHQMIMDSTRADRGTEDTLLTPIRNHLKKDQTVAGVYPCPTAVLCQPILMATALGRSRSLCQAGDLAICQVGISFRPVQGRHRNRTAILSLCPEGPPPKIQMGYETEMTIAAVTPRP